MALLFYLIDPRIPLSIFSCISSVTTKKTPIRKMKIAPITVPIPMPVIAL